MRRDAMVGIRIGGRSVGLAALAVAVIGLNGCFPISEWHPSESDRKGTVEVVRMDHQVHFAAAADTLAAEQRTRLDLFLNSVDLGYGDTVTIASVGEDTKAQRRAQLVRAYLAARKIESQLVTRAPQYGDIAPGAIAVSVSRHVLTPPQCPDRTKNANQDIYNMQSSNFGCATAQALSMMVANPADLVRGRRVGSGDGEYLALGVRRYRTDQFEELIAGGGSHKAEGLPESK